MHTAPQLPILQEAILIRPHHNVCESLEYLSSCRASDHLASYSLQALRATFKERKAKRVAEEAGVSVKPAAGRMLLPKRMRHGRSASEGRVLAAAAAPATA